MKASERWKVFQDGRPLTEIRQEPGGLTRQTEVCKFDRCMCFDYLQLKEKFDLQLEQVSAETADAREEGEKDSERQYFDRRRQPDMFEGLGNP